MNDKTVVLAMFEDERSADAAVSSLKQWEKASKNWDMPKNHVKVGAIGVLVLDDNGQVKANKLGKRSVGKGAGIGSILMLLTPVGWGGVVAGGLLGALHHKGLRMSDGDRDRISAQLAEGKVAMGALVQSEQAGLVADKMTELKGLPEVYEVTGAALEHAAAAMPGKEPVAPAGG